MITFVALGDSTTAGAPNYGSPLERPPKGQGNPESQYGYWIEKKHPDWRVINHGISGETSAQILKRVDAAIDLGPHAIIVMAGVNDLYRGGRAGDVKKNLTAMYDRITAAGIRVVACTILPYNFSEPKVREGMREVNVWIETTARERGFAFCDTAKAASDPAQPDRLSESPDGLHPGVSCYRRIGEAVASTLEMAVLFDRNFMAL